MDIRLPEEKSDMWRTREVVVAVVCLLVGSVGQLVQFLVTPVDSAGKPAENLAAAMASPSAMTAGAWLDLTTIVFFLPALAVVGYLAGARTTKLGFAATLLVIGTTLPGIAYVLAPDAMLSAATDGSIPAGAIDAYLSEPVVGFSTIVFLLGHVFGLILLGVALWRAGRVPSWAGICLALFPVAEIGGTAAGIKVVAIVGYLLMVAAFGACALAVGRQQEAGKVPVAEVQPAGY